jgi:hypothetical protein
MAYHSSEMAKRANYARDFLILPCYELKLQPVTLIKFKVENCVGRSALMAYHSNKMAKREIMQKISCSFRVTSLKLQHDEGYKSLQG